MALDREKLMAFDMQPVERRYTTHDTILYALGLGLGADPVDANQLRFVYEENLAALPTLATVLAGRSATRLRDPSLGIDWVRAVHGEERIVLHRPLPSQGAIVAKARVVGVDDKGRDKGALVHIACEIVDQASNLPLATVEHGIFFRGDGGCGSAGGAPPLPHTLPTRAPDVACDMPTLPQAALIYRLSGDDNPLHADPEFARRAGFPRPILHGLCSFGVAGHALVKTMCGYDPARLRAMQGRFSAPVFPGETLGVEMWRDGTVISFRVRVRGRDAVAIDRGRADIAG
ncbi:MAG: MaoC family dehydratase N-terminal domain-containing protein [Rhodospirillales bacterium]|nr:MaoC family dehydratase N-terminal domain-containing protein [Rhodospirillales bacterium]